MIEISLARVAQAVGASVSGNVEGVCVRRVTTDSRDVLPGDLFIALCGPNFDGHEFIDQAAEKGAVACVGSVEALRRTRRERSVPYLLVDDTVAALGRLASYYRRRIMPVETVVVGVTGSNGKTTTKGMIDCVLGGALMGRASPKSFNNHIGVPLTLLSAEADDRYLVCEIGSNAPGEVASLAQIVSPDVGVITSIGEAHLLGLKDIAGVAAEKTSLLEHIRPNGLAVVNVDRPEIRPHLGRAGQTRVVTVGVDEGAQLWVANRRGDIDGSSFLLDGRFEVKLPMPGVHHATNAVAAFAVGRWFGLPPSEIIARLGTYQPPAGRTRLIRVGGVALVDDTYNANPQSMAAAVHAMREVSSRRRIFVMGDMLELGFLGRSLHEQAVRLVLEAGVETFVAVGRTTGDAVRAVGLRGCSTRTLVCADAGAAAETLLGLLEAGDTVWIKGSRAMHLDRVVDRILCEIGRRTAVA